MPCAFLTFFANLTQMFSAGMFFCMALNLQLVIVHKVNGQKMEKFYYLGTGILAAVCSVTPLAAGVYGSRLTVYSLLAFTDPSFIRAAKKIRRHINLSDTKKNQLAYIDTDIERVHVQRGNFVLSAGVG
ncbi:hypothetical protein B0H14DRAFT_3537519 [Mycena olivaceomarginata]|nr:hypothetical protein B0H14DRAFT_3537519 [Mycena olivaceomarginata]